MLWGKVKAGGEGRGGAIMRGGLEGRGAGWTVGLRARATGGGGVGGDGEVGTGS